MVSGVKHLQLITSGNAIGRQFLSSQLEQLTGTRVAGFVLTRQTSVGKWGVATYALATTDKHRDHRGHRESEPPGCPPDAPDADGCSGASVDDSEENSSPMGICTVG